MPSTDIHPTYFTALEVANVRCFGSRQVLPLVDETGGPARWTLILGDNGVGKTTLLQCLGWMIPVQSEDEKRQFIIEPALNSEDNRTLDSLIRRTGTDIRVGLKASLTMDVPLGESGWNESARQVTTEITISGRNGLLQDRELIKNNPPEEWKQLLRQSDITVIAFGAGRRPGTLKYEGDELTSPTASLFRSSTDLYDAEEILLALDYSAVKSNNPRDIIRLNRVKEVLARVLPDVRSPEGVQILGPKAFGVSAESGVRFRTPYGEVPLAALSLGYQTTLTWVVDLSLRLYERYPNSIDPLAEPAIVLIDNIDLHLHPRWQRRMMEDVTKCFPSTQFIATAHSPLIVQAAENANLVVLRTSGGEVKIETHVGSVTDWRVDQILASELFDIPARGPVVERLMSERDELLDRGALEVSERQRLRELEEQLQNLRTEEDPRDQAAIELIRDVAAGLRSKGEVKGGR